VIGTSGEKTFAFILMRWYESCRECKGCATQGRKDSYVYAGVKTLAHRKLVGCYRRVPERPGKQMDKENR